MHASCWSADCAVGTCSHTLHLPPRYDRKELLFRKLIDLQFVAAMGPPGGGRNGVTNRYLRHYSVVSVTQFDNENLT